MVQEKSQGGNDSRLESGLGKEPRSQHRSRRTEQTLSKQVDSDGRQDRSRELGSQWSSSCSCPDTGEQCLATEDPTELPGFKWTLSSPQGLPCVITLFGLGLVSISGQVELTQA